MQTSRALADAGLHPLTGGDGSLLCSGDMLLEALVACAGVTLRAVSTSLGILVRSGRVLAEGDLDFRGTLGVDRAAPVGFSAIRLSFELDTDADEAQLATLGQLTERYCVVYQTLAGGPASVPASPPAERAGDGRVTRGARGSDPWTEPWPSSPCPSPLLWLWSCWLLPAVLLALLPASLWPPAFPWPLPVFLWLPELSWLLASPWPLVLLGAVVGTLALGV